jgi:hypothetical protein
MKKKTIANKFRLLSIALVVLSFTLIVQAQAETKNEKPITCEYLKVILDGLVTKSSYSLTEKASLPYAVFIVSPGSRKDSNAKVALKFVRGLNTLLKTSNYQPLRYAIIESKQKKGYGRLQIYFIDEVKEFDFADNIFLCP